MQTKKVTQYKCDYCKKKGLSASHMSRHEKHCTMNPDRYCRMCDLLGHEQANIKDMLSILPDPKLFEDDSVEWNNVLPEQTEIAMPKLRDITNNCPMCIMAALRQKGIPVLMINSFDYKKEVEELFYQHNQDQLEKDHGYY